MLNLRPPGKSVLYTRYSVKKCLIHSTERQKVFYMERIRHFLPGGLKLSNVDYMGKHEAQLYKCTPAMRFGGPLARREHGRRTSAAPLASAAPRSSSAAAQPRARRMAWVTSRRPSMRHTRRTPRARLRATSEPRISVGAAVRRRPSRPDTILATLL